MAEAAVAGRPGRSPSAVPSGRGRARLVVWGATAAFALLFGWLALHRLEVFGSQVFDLGIFDQGWWLLSRFQEPFVTLRGLHLFADHSSYLLVALVPLAWLWPDPAALVVVTVVAVAAAAPLVYAVGRGEGLRPRLAAGLAVAFLLAPATQWSTWDSFHPETLTIPLLVGAFALAQRRRWWWSVVLLAVVLTAKEDAALVVLPFAAYLGWRWRRPREALVAAGLAVAALVLNFAVLLPHFSPTGELLYTGRYAELGEGPGGLLVGVVTKPGVVLDLLTGPSQAAYLAGMLLPLALCLLAPDVLAIALPVTLANLLSTHHYQHELRWHYTAYLVAVVAVAAPVGARRLVAWRPRLDRPLLVGVVVAAALAGSLVAGPWPLDQRNPWSGWTDDAGAVHRALALVPGDAVVSADWLAGVHLAERERVYEFPAPFRPPLSAWAAPGVPLPPAADVEWVVVTGGIRRASAEAAAALADLLADPAFEVVLDEPAVVVLRRSG